MEHGSTDNAAESAAPGSALAGPASGRWRDGMALVVVLLGFLVVPMAMSGTSVALPEISADLGGGAALQWVITGYFLAATCLMLVAGTLGDRYGRRRMFRVGVVVYATSTLGAGLAGGVLLLVVARILSGAGAASMMACGGAILASTFSGTARNQVFGAMGTAVGIGLAFGPTVAGWLVTGLDWRAMFVTFAAAGLLLLVGSLFIRESRAEQPGGIDVWGILAFIAGMVGLMYGTNRIADLGWVDPLVLGCIAGGVVMLAVFIALQRRTDQPVLDLSLVRHPPFLGWLVAALTIAVGTVGVLVYLPAYLQGAAGFTARGAGAVMLAMTLPILAVPPVAGRLVSSGVPARLLVLGAIGSLAAGNAWLTVLQPDTGAAALVGPLLLAGIGDGLAIAIIDAQAMNLVGPDRVGMASGLLNTMRAAANTIVLGVFGALLITVLQADIEDRALASRIVLGDIERGEPAFADRFTSAWRVALWAVAVLCVLLGLVVLRLTRSTHFRPADVAHPATC